MDHDASTSRSFTTQRRRAKSRAAIGGLILSAAACGGELDQRDLGETGTQSDPIEGSSDRTPVVVDGVISDFIAGDWIGQAEDLFAPSRPDGERPVYTFPSGSTQIDLNIYMSDDHPLGMIVFGAGPAPVPSAGVVYPPGFHPGPLLPRDGLSLELPPVEGFAYNLRESVFTSSGSVIAAGTLALDYAPNQAYTRWCGLQPTRALGDGSYDCLTLSASDDPNAACFMQYEDGHRDTFDCDLYSLCLADNVCDCSERGCEAAGTSAGELWLMRSGDDLLVTFSGTAFDYGDGVRLLPAGSVRFIRAH